MQFKLQSTGLILESDWTTPHHHLNSDWLSEICATYQRREYPRVKQINKIFSIAAREVSSFKSIAILSEGLWQKDKEGTLQEWSSHSELQLWMYAVSTIKSVKNWANQQTELEVYLLVPFWTGAGFVIETDILLSNLCLAGARNTGWHQSYLFYTCFKLLMWVKMYNYPNKKKTDTACVACN